MKKYQVKITPQANGQILEYALYIQNELCNPQAAQKFLEDMRNAINNLDQSPSRHSLTEEEPWHGEEIRRAVVRGYLVYFWVDEERDTVHVIAVIYEKRDQAEQLSKIDMKD
nr:type II toxin-antitoxin system RelE/ParE family toxin [Massilistercora timonensis]